MSFILEALRDKPAGLWMLDGNSPFVDYTGHGLSATSATVTNGIAVAAGVVRSLVTSNSKVATFVTPVFKQGYEVNSFSLEASVRPIISSAISEQQVLGNSGLMDGLTINGSVVSFVTKYTSTGECRVSYDIGAVKSVYLVGVHTPTKNQLYVDGQLVGEEDIADDQLTDTYAAGTGTLVSGKSTSTNELLINGIGVYQVALNAVSVQRHYSYARDLDNPIVNFFDGENIYLSNESADIAFYYTWVSDEDWLAADLQDTIVDDAALIPAVFNDVSLPGTWRDSVDLYQAGTATPLRSVSLNWNGEGETVKVSLDGVTWETVVKNIAVSSIPNGFVPNNQELYIQVSFNGGVVEDSSYIQDLTLTALKSNSSTITGGVSITYTGEVHVMNEFEPAELRDDWGSLMRNGGYATITPDPIDPVRTIEVWFKALDLSTNVRLVDTRTNTDVSQPYMTVGFNGGSNTSSGFTKYLNGQPWGSAPTKAGEWAVAHLVSAADITSPILVNTGYAGAGNTGNIQIGRVVLYPDTLTSQNIVDIVAGYTGRLSTRVVDSDRVRVIEPATPASIYAHDWAIDASG